ncbi:MAG: TatD family hydrolase, partial [Nanoarchaeota archaeon]|nr:TatD family hydrolase [Nanoarchaeota archaeon]MBU2519701.1 TatD family hydrolase [Nanoarchaeota archaeon]
VRQAKKEGMSAVIVSSARYEEGLEALKLAKKHPGFIFVTLGHHPTEGDHKGKGYNDVIQLIRDNIDSICGIGEVGLDFHHEHDAEKHKKQKKVFQKFINLAKELKKPLVIHSWDAEKECYETVKGSGLTCVFHCYSGSKDLAEEIIKQKNFYISISTGIMFSKQLRKVAKLVPMNRILLETDAPFLDPDRERKRNVPWNIKLSAEKIAKERKCSSEEILKTTEKNAIRVFGLGLK